MNKLGLAKICLGLLCIICLSVLMPLSVQAAVFNVGCGDTAALKTAIIDANNETLNPGPDVIELAPGCLYEIAAAHTGSLGLPLISSVITINAHGSTIMRTGVATYRIMYVNASGELNLNSATITNGDAGGNVAGGISVAGILRISDSQVVSNSAHSGGGIYINAGTVEVINSQVSNNIATLEGGGIYNGYGTLHVTGSVIGSNTAVNGGGIAMYGYNNLIENSILVNNMADNNGGYGEGGAFFRMRI